MLNFYKRKREGERDINVYVNDILIILEISLSLNIKEYNSSLAS